MKPTSIQKYAGAAAVFALSMMLSSLILWGTRGAQAQQKSDAPVFGSVSVQKILSESSARKRDSDELNKMVQSLREVMTSLRQQNAFFLPEAELRELASLLEKENASAVEKKRIAELFGKAAAASAEKRKLENTANPSEEQRKQFAALSDAESKGNQAINNLAGAYEKRLGEREVELNNKTVAEIRTAISEVAKQKGITVVFDEQIAIYTANDLTPDVIKQINK
ncbi:MAG: hypothetical protein OHK0029_02300 [Armatimonadaceae bacterium]